MLQFENKYMSNYLELTQLSDGTIVLRRSDDHENPIVKIEFSRESKEFLDGQELVLAKEMIRAGIESVSGNAIDFDDFFDNQKKSLRKKPVTLH
jgi:hypothetical protein